MKDYTELCRRLRALAEGCSNLSQQGYDLLNNAADTIERLADENTRLVTTANELSKMYDKLVDEMPDGWIPVAERLPENNVHVLLSCRTYGGNKYVCDGFHTEKFSTPTEFYEDIDADYNEETDEYYFPEGWWEVIKNWDDYSCVAIEDTVTHWMPLPEPPEPPKEDEA